MVAERMDRRSRGELVRLESRIGRDESRAAWGRVIRLADRGHLSVVADRADLADQSFGEIHHIAARRLRQLGSDDAA